MAKRRKMESASSIEDVLSNEDLIDSLTGEAIAWANANGLVMGHSKEIPTTIHAPFSLLPTRLPVKVYDNLTAYAPLFNRLVDRVSRDHKFLRETLLTVIDCDDFTKRLLKILQIVDEKGGYKQPIMLGVNRSDYMIHSEDGQEDKPLQVELNTIAASFGCLSTKVASMHHYLLSRYLPEIPLDYLPVNKAMQGIARAIATASKRHSPLPSRKVAVVMVVQPGESNSTDQRLIEYELWTGYQVPLLRRTLGEIHKQATLDPATGDLEIEGTTISVIYFRAGYTPKDYLSDKEWDALLLIEQSHSIKCPSVAYHLAGSKKVQQAVAARGVVEHFLGEEEGKKLRECFAGLWGLEKDDKETKEVIQKAIASPSHFVLKPQREGGGNNLWGEEMVKVLSSATLQERSQYILMARIMPRLHSGALVRAGAVRQGKSSDEYGIYSSYLSDGEGEEFLNECLGHLVRTKFEGTDEGGVAAGYAVLNSPILSP